MRSKWMVLALVAVVVFGLAGCASSAQPIETVIEESDQTSRESFETQKVGVEPTVRYLSIGGIEQYFGGSSYATVMPSSIVIAFDRPVEATSVEIYVLDTPVKVPMSFRRAEQHELLAQVRNESFVYYAEIPSGAFIGDEATFRIYLPSEQGSVKRSYDLVLNERTERVTGWIAWDRRDESVYGKHGF